nr:SLC13 family permease [Candidatus Scalindua japonica]
MASVFVAMLLFVISKVDVEQMLEEIEWDTLLFFSGLFALVGVLEEKGVSEWLAHNVFLRAGDIPYFIVLMVLWVSGLTAGLLNNIPFTIAMVPIVKLMQESNPIPNNILWWALVLGTCFGGNLTILGASVNIVTVGIVKKYKHNISFLEFMRSETRLSGSLKKK